MPVTFLPYNPISSLDKIITKEDGSPLQGEINIYKKLFSDLSISVDDWFVWHDLKLPSHSDSSNYYKKISAQIDFLILCKEGLLVLEVKGEKIVYDISKFIKDHPGQGKIFNGVEANMCYKDKTIQPISPTEIFNNNTKVTRIHFHLL